MTDIVERLRDIDERDCFIPDKLCHEAAEEIERLRKEVTSITVIHTNAIIEGCAQVAENFRYASPEDQIAAAIRALKDKT